MKTFDFDEENKKGLNGEQFVARLYGWKRLTKKGPDFRTPKNEIVELKTDYRARQTGRVFIEKWSNAERETLGGPFRAHAEGCDYFSILIWDKENKKGTKLISFEPKCLIDHLKELGYDEDDLLSVQNKKYTTKGWAVPIKRLKESSECIVDNI